MNGSIDEPDRIRNSLMMNCQVLDLGISSLTLTGLMMLQDHQSSVGETVSEPPTAHQA